MRLRTYLVGALLLSVGAGGCFSSATQEEHFYSFKGPTGSIKSGQGPRVLVADFTASAGYETERLAYRMSDHELRYYGYHKWTADPARLTKEMVARQLSASAQFAEVGYNDKMRSPDLIVDGVVEAIEELDHGKAWKAHLAMRFVVRSGDSDRVLLRFSFDQSVGCKSRHPREVARGISKILNQQATVLAKMIIERAGKGVSKYEAEAPKPSRSAEDEAARNEDKDTEKTADGARKK